MTSLRKIIAVCGPSGTLLLLLISFQTYQHSASDSSSDGIIETSSPVSEFIPNKDTVTDEELEKLTEQIYALEGQNNAADLVVADLQDRVKGLEQDHAPNVLLRVDATAYSKPTIAKLLPLHNNYVPGVGDAENITAEETGEELDFLREIITTPIMTRVHEFLSGTILNISKDREAFMEEMHNIWFGMYNRAKKNKGSSGFEHIFLGETKKKQVSGFHNWIFFSREEANNHANYYGHTKSVSLGSKGSVLKYSFKWLGVPKPVASMFVGTSPEFEMALYTVCFYVRPGRRCRISLNDRKLSIRTFFISKNRKKYVASGYPEI